MAAKEHPPDNYILGRNHRSSARLNLLHSLYTQLSGGLINRGIPLKQDARVADIAAGTGIWSINITDHLPNSTTVDAFDISPDQFPHSSLLPPNVHFHVHDMFKPFPEEFLGKYDLVALRFLVTIVDSRTLGPLVENVVTLLKPGGYIQWVEPDHTELESIVSADNAEAPQEAMSKLAKIMRNPGPKSEPEWVLGLETALTSAGLQNVSTTHYPVPPKYRHYFTQVSILSVEDIIVADRTWYAGKFDTVEQAVAQLSAELKRGAGIDRTFRCVIAHKSL